eukprot:scaffold269421_cov35-Attheya_sp.AAC.1
MAELERRSPKGCDTFIAYPPTTANGHVVFGKNSDRPAGEGQSIRRYPASTHHHEEPGSSTCLKLIGCGDANMERMNMVWSLAMRLCGLECPTKKGTAYSEWIWFDLAWNVEPHPGKHYKSLQAFLKSMDKEGRVRKAILPLPTIIPFSLLISTRRLYWKRLGATGWQSDSQRELTTYQTD